MKRSGWNSEGLPKRKPQSFFICLLLFAHLLFLIFQLTRHSVLWPRLLSLKHKFIFSLYLLFMLFIRGCIVRINMFIQTSLDLKTFRAGRYVSNIWCKDLLHVCFNCFPSFTTCYNQRFFQLHNNHSVWHKLVNYIKHLKIVKV